MLGCGDLQWFEREEMRGGEKNVSLNCEEKHEKFGLNWELQIWPSICMCMRMGCGCIHGFEALKVNV